MKWEEIGGLKETKEILEKVIIDPLKVSSDSTLPKGIMLYGPPGSGKTMIAKALANNSGMNFISIKGPELLSKYLGESEQLIKNFFNKARQVSPSILFFDEIDSICSSSLEKSSDSVTSRILSQILLELDGFSELNNVVILAATNKIEKIDKYLLRMNDFMIGMFRGIGIKLVDFKVEFGRYKNNGKTEIILADEISPDTCRLWDLSSDKKLDKDRFRKNLGNVMQGYQDVARRLGILHEESNIRTVKFPKPKAVKIKRK